MDAPDRPRARGTALGHSRCAPASAIRAWAESGRSSGPALGHCQQETLERLAAPRSTFAGRERLGKLGVRVTSAYRQHYQRRKRGVEVELPVRGVEVEPAHLVDAQPVGLRLDAERRDGLSGVE